jgi:5-methylcytosine-specific restriction endonuclease McrA
MRKVCVECGDTYIARSPLNQKYCSKECREANFDSRNREKMAEDIRNGTGKNWLKVRFMVFRRDNFTCQYCGHTVRDGIKLNIDHINPKSNCGQYAIDNLITACFDCNQGKRDVLLNKREIDKLIRTAR